MHFVVLFRISVLLVHAISLYSHCISTSISASFLYATFETHWLYKSFPFAHCPSFHGLELTNVLFRSPIIQEISNKYSLSTCKESDYEYSLLIFHKPLHTSVLHCSTCATDSWSYVRTAVVYVHTAETLNNASATTYCGYTVMRPNGPLNTPFYRNVYHGLPMAAK